MEISKAQRKQAKIKLALQGAYEGRTPAAARLHRVVISNYLTTITSSNIPFSPA